MYQNYVQIYIVKSVCVSVMSEVAFEVVLSGSSTMTTRCCRERRFVLGLSR
jgi:hypothetical protein